MPETKKVTQKRHGKWSKESEGVRSRKLADGDYEYEFSDPEFVKEISKAAKIKGVTPSEFISQTIQSACDEIEKITKTKSIGKIKTKKAKL